MGILRMYKHGDSGLYTKDKTVTLSIEPHAELPSDMKENYHFGEI